MVKNSAFKRGLSDWTKCVNLGKVKTALGSSHASEQSLY